MTRPSHVLRIAGSLAIVAGLASCSQGAGVSPTAQPQLTHQQVQYNSEGTIPACRGELVGFTTEARVLGSPHTTAVEVTATLINRGKFACALRQPQTACFTDPSGEITTTDGRVLWNPRYLALPCPARPPGEPPVLVYPGHTTETNQTWNLFICGPDVGCGVPDPAGRSTQARAAPGKNVAVGTSDIVGNARGAPFTIS